MSQNLQILYIIFLQINLYQIRNRSYFNKNILHIDASEILLFDKSIN